MLCSLAFQGHDFHPFCADVPFVEPALNQASAGQIASRACRYGQKRDMSVTRLFARDTENEVQEFKLLVKAAPYLHAVDAVNGAISDVRARYDPEQLTP